jgi:hypothetical protein
MNPSDVRADLVRALRLDLIGPESAEEMYQDEVLAQTPSRWYLTGFLVPYEADAEDRQDEASNEQLDMAVAGAGDDEDAPEPASARKAFLPSSLGISVLVPESAHEIAVTATWGDYKLEPASEGEGADATPARWRRTARHVVLPVKVPAKTLRPQTTSVPGSGDLRVVVSVRTVAKSLSIPGIASVPAGTRAVSVFLVNHRKPKDGDLKDEALAFQAALAVRCEEPFVARPNLRDVTADSWDEKVADLQYRDACEYAVGHGVSTCATVVDGACRDVRTTWLPTAEVEKVEAAAIDGVQLSMEALSKLTTAADASAQLMPMVNEYRKWIVAQRGNGPAAGPRASVAKDLCDQAARAADRIEAGIQEMAKPDVLRAFCLANQVMATAARQRQAQTLGGDPSAVKAPEWRPFQLAFLLMSIRGISDPAHVERDAVELLFFPTGGGKTEAYLGLAAFTLLLRRLRNPELTSAGVSVLMRYTLRLLTLDQLSRAATLICALELERQRDVSVLGTWPFEIGLWVGKAATPNRMGRKGDGAQDTARSRTIAYLTDDKKPCPVPLENCPWCGTKFTPRSFRLVPNADQPLDLRIACTSRRCAFTGDRTLPVVTVDEAIYRRLPCFLIATVDKFASLPWVGQVGALFGKVDRYDREGFYGAADPRVRSRMPAELLPPDLIIQDELHLISGPLGTMAGLYETALEALATRVDGEKRIRPKIVASTATVRRADHQVHALFARSRVDVFPPPGPDRRDSFFAKTVPRDQKNARLYVGLAAPGRSVKVMYLRSHLALMASVQKAYLTAGGKKASPNPADPYMTVVGYFNALRELGGTRRIVEDEVSARLASYGDRRRVGEAAGLFADRRIRYEPVELTSRERTDHVAESKRRLGLPASSDESIDIALATNMISVGLDITRLGLMVVLGQPKTTAEYIQASSRVGRDDQRPGLVLTILNIHRPRDRSHYERFEAYHQSFYRSVEATSVTPFSPRAIDRALAAVTVGLARQGHGALTAGPAALAITHERRNLGFVAEVISRRAEKVASALDPSDREALRQAVLQRVNDLLDEWDRIADGKRKANATLQYQEHEATGPHLLYDPLDPELQVLTAGPRKFKAHRSLRDVEPSVPLWVKRLDGVEIPPEDVE